MTSLLFFMHVEGQAAAFYKQKSGELGLWESTDEEIAIGKVKGGAVLESGQC